MKGGGIGEEHEKMNKGRVNGRKKSNLMDTEENEKGFFLKKKCRNTEKKMK